MGRKEDKYKIDLSFKETLKKIFKGSKEQSKKEVKNTAKEIIKSNKEVK